MRGATVVIAVLLLVGCGGGTTLGARLDRLGYFRFARDPAAARAAVDRDGTDGLFTVEVRRLFAADAEDLAEGGVGQQLRALRPPLARLHVRVPAVRDDVAATRYRVRVGARTYTIWTAAEERRESRQPGIVWGVATARTVRILDDLLRAAHTRERFYALYGGNDLNLWLLTPELERTIAAAVDDPRDRPYVPLERYDGGWFGAPH